MEEVKDVSTSPDARSESSHRGGGKVMLDSGSERKQREDG